MKPSKLYAWCMLCKEAEFVAGQVCCILSENMVDEKKGQQCIGFKIVEQKEVYI
jgi:hypothetical protein